MYQARFGTQGQMAFANASDYYELLGFLCNNNGSTSIVAEPNDEQGAWTWEGRIQFHVVPPAALRARLSHTAGRGTSIVSRVNCNEFVVDILTNHAFVVGATQAQAAVLMTVPRQHIPDFNRGLIL